MSLVRNLLAVTKSENKVKGKRPGDGYKRVPNFAFLHQTLCFWKY